MTTSTSAAYSACLGSALVIALPCSGYVHLWAIHVANGASVTLLRPRQRDPGRGRSIDEDDRDLEAEIDRDAIAAGIVPKMVGQATLESASVTDSSVLQEEDVDDETATLPRSRPGPGRTGVGRVARRDTR